MTKAFETRVKNQEKIAELYHSIENVLMAMATLRDESAHQYEQYLSQLRNALPQEAANALPAYTIAAHLSDDPKEQRSICASIVGFARAAREKRSAEEYNKITPPQYYDSMADSEPTLPTLKSCRFITTRHFAELDDEGNQIRQWDKKSIMTTYYLDKEG